MQNCFPAPKSGIDLTGACNSLVPGVHTYSQESREEVYSENKRRACVMKKMLQQKYMCNVTLWSDNGAHQTGQMRTCLPRARLNTSVVVIFNWCSSS